MKLFIDLSATQPRAYAYHGGGECTRVIALELLKRNKKRPIYAFYDPDRDIDKAFRSAKQEGSLRLYPATNKKELASVLDEIKPDLFYSGVPYRYYHWGIKIPKQVFHVHGTRPIEMPTDSTEWRYNNSPKALLGWLIKRNFTRSYKRMHMRRMRRLLAFKDARKGLVVTASNHSRNMIRTLFPDLKAPVRVLYSPLRPSSYDGEEPLEERKKRFVLVSGDRWVKNTRRALVAFDRLVRSGAGKDCWLTVTGIQRYGSLFSGLKNTKRIEVKGYISPQELDQLYATSLCLVYPSLNEGFGYPPLEAMRKGTPVICSGLASMPEVCGLAALYFNPFSVEEIQSRMLEILENSATRRRLGQTSKTRYEFMQDKQEQQLGAFCDDLLAGEIG